MINGLDFGGTEFSSVPALVGPAEVAATLLTGVLGGEPILLLTFLLSSLLAPLWTQSFQLQTLQKAQQHSDHWCQPSPLSSQSPELLMYCQYYVELAGKHCFLHLKFHLYFEQFSPLFQYFSCIDLFVP